MFYETRYGNIINSFHKSLYQTPTQVRSYIPLCK